MAKNKTDYEYSDTNDLSSIHFGTVKSKKRVTKLRDTVGDDEDDDPNAPFPKETAAILGFTPTDEDFN